MMMNQFEKENSVATASIDDDEDENDLVGSYQTIKHVTYLSTLYKYSIYLISLPR